MGIHGDGGKSFLPVKLTAVCPSDWLHSRHYHIVFSAKGPRRREDCRRWSYGQYHCPLDGLPKVSEL